MSDSHKDSSTFDTSSSQPESRIGYDQLANQAITSSGIGAQFLDSASSNVGSSYMDYDINNNNNFGVNNFNMYGHLRRRNGLFGQQAGHGDQGMNTADTQNYLGLTGSGLGGVGYAGLSGIGGVGLTGFGQGIGRQGYGHSGSGYGGGVVSGYGPAISCQSGVNPLLALLTLAGAGLGFYFIYIKLINATGRKFGSHSFLQSFEDMADKIWIGMHSRLFSFKFFKITKIFSCIRK